MNVLTFDKIVNKDELIGWIGLTVDEWYKGSGVYCVEIGSRNEIESLDFYGQVTGVVVNDIDDDEDEDFAYISENVNGIVECCVTDEHSFLYFKVA